MQENQANGSLFKKYVANLTIANFLGIIISAIIVALVHQLNKFIFSTISDLWFPFSTIEFFNVAFFVIESYKAGSDFGKDNMIFLILMFLAVILFDLIKIAICSMFLRGLYGVAVDAVFYDKASISGYFKHMISKNNAGKMFIFSFWIVFVVYLVFLIIDLDRFFENFILNFLFILTLLFILSLVSHVPLLIMKERMGLREAIGFSLKLLDEKPKQLIKTILKMYLSYCTILVPIGFSIIFIYASIFGKYSLTAILFVITGWVFIFIIFLIMLSLGIAIASLILTNDYKKYMRSVIFPDGNSQQD